MMEAQVTTQTSASERLTKEIMDQQLNVQEVLRPAKKEARNHKLPSVNYLGKLVDSKS